MIRETRVKRALLVPQVKQDPQVKRALLVPLVKQGPQVKRVPLVPLVKQVPRVLLVDKARVVPLAILDLQALLVILVTLVNKALPVL